VSGPQVVEAVIDSPWSTGGGRQLSDLKGAGKHRISAYRDWERAKQNGPENRDHLEAVHVTLG
jgi:hypothetical protein